MTRHRCTVRTLYSSGVLFEFSRNLGVKFRFLKEHTQLGKRKIHMYCRPELCVVKTGHLLLVGEVADDKAGQVGHHGD